ncbi:hypothetical protein F5X68DRAFT_229374 [Plectosphaerella plurivora]|uniref:C2H2-type domain-containing protein n=1 Tax=Plectosphaerella plurivora TaxID=936078 RepID=A0A9P9AFC9_9PEZI|nr:hypothetical protein F5X68DRAFT_229374 [Plectosphaerella plurivora]
MTGKEPPPNMNMAQGMPPTPNLLAQMGPNGQPWSKFSFANFDWSLYDYHPADDGGFWQLQPNMPPSEQLPLMIPLQVTKRSPVQQQKDIEWTCLSPACPSKPFKRKPDLDRHYKMAHPNGVPLLLAGGSVTTPTFEHMPVAPAPSGLPPNLAGLAPGGGASPTMPQDGNAAGAAAAAGTLKDGGKEKDKDAVFNCDYPVCPRKTDGFNRKDRFRVHLQDLHKEDVVKKGGILDDAWLAGRKMYTQWWRCSKCLGRVRVDEHGWECPRDQVKCEEKRREYRENMMTDQ